MKVLSTDYQPVGNNLKSCLRTVADWVRLFVTEWFGGSQQVHEADCKTCRWQSTSNYEKKCSNSVREFLQHRTVWKNLLHFAGWQLVLSAVWLGHYSKVFIPWSLHWQLTGITHHNDHRFLYIFLGFFLHLGYDLYLLNWILLQQQKSLRRPNTPCPWICKVWTIQWTILDYVKLSLGHRPAGL